MAKKNKTKKRRTQTGEILHRFRKNTGAMIGLAFILILTVLALLGNVIYDYDTDIIGQNYEQRFVRPCWEHPFGTDNLGRDLFARVIYGARASLPVGFLAVLVSLFFGLVFGAVAGFYGGVTDNIIMRIMDIFNTIPTILMAIVMIVLIALLFVIEGWFGKDVEG